MIHVVGQTQALVVPEHWQPIRMENVQSPEAVDSIPLCEFPLAAFVTFSSLSWMASTGGYLCISLIPPESEHLDVLTLSFSKIWENSLFLSPWIPALSSFLWFTYLILNHLDINLLTEVSVAKISLGFQEKNPQIMASLACKESFPSLSNHWSTDIWSPDIFLHPDLSLSLHLFTLFCALTVSECVTRCPLRHTALTLYGVTHKK